MSHRLFRASITIAILALAVAFLSHMLAFSVVERETQRSAWNELRESRLLGEIVSRTANVDTPRAIVAGLASDDPHRLGEYRAWSGAPTEQFERARSAARSFEQFEVYLVKTGPAQRAALFGDETTDEAAAALAEPGQLDHFLLQLAAFGLRVPLGGAPRLKAFVFSERPLLSEVVGAVAVGHTRAIAQLTARFAEADTNSLASAQGSQLFANPPANLCAVAREQGFDTSLWDVSALTAFTTRVRDRADVEHVMVSDPTRSELARELDVPPAEISLAQVLGYAVGSERHAASVSAILTRGGVKHLDAARTSALARDFVRAQQVELAAGSDAPSANAWFGISTRNLWLVLLSFLVCGVGVANAMLMSVGERFAEIATMKCLGALDGFVMTLFLFEAAIQGVIGGVIGLILGALLALGRGFAEYGGLLAAAHSAAGQVALALGAALVLGVLLAALAAVGPSFVAARLSPMEAMRID
jgi:putative ABC transport system permease protein